jgi:hypothetical protein
MCRGAWAAWHTKFMVYQTYADMSEEERMARQQVMRIININAKNYALKLLQCYNDPYECWTRLKARYESDSGPCRVMLADLIKLIIN